MNCKTMRVFKTLTVLIFFLQIPEWQFGQRTNAAVFTPIFEDLPIDDPASNSILRQNETPAEKIRQNIYITASLNKRRCFLGEPLLLTYTLYSALQSKSAINRPPSLYGFLTTEMEVHNEFPQYKKANGRNYRIFDIKRLQLIPSQLGSLVIERMVVNNEVHYKKENKNNHYAGLVDSKELKIEVLPLPGNAPTDFTGLIGKFKVVSSVKTSSIPEGENNQLQIVITGSGNFQHFSAPDIQWPPGIEAFASTEHLDLKNDTFPTSGEKTWSIPFVGKKEGQYDIPAISISYFDPSTASYKSIKTATIKLAVGPPLPKPQIVKEHITNTQEKVPYYYWILLGVTGAVIGLLVAKLMRTKRRDPGGEEATLVTQPAPESPLVVDFKQELKAIETISDPKDYIVQFKTLLLGYVQEKLEDDSALEETLLNRIKEKNSKLASHIVQLNNECNFLLYAPGSLDERTRAEINGKFVEIIELGETSE